ncbi:Serine/threonine protein phosphatase PP1 isozyme 2, putative [Trichomonas vaginalis G3]|uniref:Serine/threonine-protein phosphatase n=1 Tax=Trichomonas vaginalis (strain ATCC PRA-98 / G3) TaxID=412133 RepID=A2F650_TRIV3|nr:phosphoprotein phosphatase protein [Trichomonas vaginalis G3]EAX99620.1 Serine/threonine protein phosphatase PP1 isozyme 2, putative [Trichomonas vaginalis G3]KAI5532135.1 phosphoprotein phosphatase protein [Trichomonas vaginalis G3]|eukprot:XP_001312550.1 Serine/threonine protein phosphatase PP1 isozyme 2 [Trichomonas vaginalis G3]
MFIYNEVMKLFMAEKVCLEISAPINICGDIHGQFDDLCRIFEINGTPETQRYLFLGDYVDRGDNSINTICLLFAYKIKYPNNIYLLRGNHESATTNRDYGFRSECLTRYSNTIYTLFNDVFCWLPISALLDGKILCLHGGLSPDITSLESLQNIKRSLEIPEEGLVCDLVWSDATTSQTEWGPSLRQTSLTFGRKAAENIVKKLNLNLIVRAHQFTSKGYDYPFSPEGSVLTIFSAPNYSGHGNPGAVLHISNTLDCSFSLINPRYNYNSNYDSYL